MSNFAVGIFQLIVAKRLRMRSVFRVVFYLRSNYVNKSGKASVMIRIYLDSERTPLGASGVFVYPEQWDSKSSRVKGRTSEALQIKKDKQDYTYKVLQEKIYLQEVEDFQT